MIKKILVITDSLGLPRAHPEKCSFEATWPCRLKAIPNLIVHQLSMGGATIDELYNQVINHHIFFNPDIIIIQSGIVDCSPRAFSRTELLLLNSTFITREIRAIIVKRFSNFLRRHRKVAYTTEKKFMFFLNNFHKISGTNTIFWLGILPGSEKYEKKVPGITKRINLYNKRIAQIFNENYISLETIPRDGIMSDQHHLNKEGHQYIYNLIVQKLNLG